MNSPTDRQKQFPDQEIGGSCQFEGCSKYDFLPFKCSGCDKSFCQEHRSALMHSCASKVKVFTDATSLDCIICGRSIRYNKGDDVNQIWEQHYLHECTKEQQQKVKTKTCSVKICRTVLGISNSYTCKHCNQTVCLSHRRQEDHNCMASRSSSSAGSRADFINKLSSNSNQAKKPANKASTNLVGKGKNNTSSNSNSSNTGKNDKRGGGSKLPVRSSSSATAAVLECPFCFDTHWSSPAQLQTHVESCMSSAQSGSRSSSSNASLNAGSINRGQHIGLPIVLDSPQRETGNSSTGSRAAAGRGGERCPQCDATFTDPVALVTHFEEAHGGNAAKKKCTIA